MANGLHCAIGCFLAALSVDALEALCEVNHDDTWGQHMVSVLNCQGPGCKANGVDNDCAWCVSDTAKCRTQFGQSCDAIVRARGGLCRKLEPVDFAAWDRVMRKHVHPGKVREGTTINEVDYCGIKADPDYLRFMTSLASARTTGLSKKEFYALFMNAYNALIINQMINQCMEGANGTCVKQLRNIGEHQGAAWSKPAGVIAGQIVSTETVEGWLRDPSKAGYNFSEDCRVHSCIVCAGISCPDLRNEAYVPDRLDEQMNDNSVKWLANPRKGAAVIGETQLNVSMIINQLYPVDMRGCYGELGPVAFVDRFGPPQVRQFIARRGAAHVKLGSFEYNWNANGVVPCDGTCPMIQDSQAAYDVQHVQLHI